MTVNEIVELVVSILPSMMAVLTTVGIIAKTLKEFAELKKEVTDLKAIEDVKVELKQILEENYALKKTLNETMTKIDHVERKV